MMSLVSWSLAAKMFLTSCFSATLEWEKSVFFGYFDVGAQTLGEDRWVSAARFPGKIREKRESVELFSFAKHPG